jgi:hypothetical protein
VIMKFRFITLVSVFISILLLFDCTSNKLDRNKAADLIKKFYEYPNIEVANFNLENIFGNPFEPLINQGYIYINRSVQWNWVNSPTQKGKKFQSKLNNNLFATNRREFNEITGIAYLDERESKARIEFSFRRSEITPFGTFLGFIDGQVVNCSVEAMKYDDGWRITSSKEVNFNPQDFQYIADLEYIANGEKLWNDSYVTVSNAVKQRDFGALLKLSNPDDSGFNSNNLPGISAKEFFKQNLTDEQWKLLEDALKIEVRMFDNKKYAGGLEFEFKDNRWIINGLILGD